MTIDHKLEKVDVLARFTPQTTKAVEPETDWEVMAIAFADEDASIGFGRTHAEFDSSYPWGSW